jgi:hypothetical protein
MKLRKLMRLRQQTTALLLRFICLFRYCWWWMKDNFDCCFKNFFQIVLNLCWTFNVRAYELFAECLLSSSREPRPVRPLEFWGSNWLILLSSVLIPLSESRSTSPCIRDLDSQLSCFRLSPRSSLWNRTIETPFLSFPVHISSLSPARLPYPFRSAVTVHLSPIFVQFRFCRKD